MKHGVAGTVSSLRFLAAAAPLLLLAGAWPGSTLEAQNRDRCAPAESFLTEEYGMEAVTEPDTLDDWRSGRSLPGCRVTAAGSTSRSLDDEAEAFYQKLRSAGWERTPEPRDAPNESSLRFRRGDTDCLFNVYSGGILGTEAEREVDTAVDPGFGERRFNLLVLCAPAVEAEPRGG